MFGRFLAAVLAALFACSPAFALSPAQQSVLFAKKPAAASYVGPGDVVAMTFWVGMRAYSAATRGVAAVNICSESGGVDVTCEDELTSATTGKLVLGTIGSTCGSITCTVKTWYDPTGNDFCGASTPCNFTQTTVANRATFLITGCPGSSGQPCASFNGSSDCYNSVGTANSSVPYSESIVSEVTSASVNQTVLVFTGSILGIIGYNPPNTAVIYSGVAITATASDSVLHAIQGVFDGSSGLIYVDGSSTGGNDGAGNATLPAAIGAISCSSQFFGGYLLEAGFSTAQFSGGNVSSLTSNQRTFWGF